MFMFCFVCVCMHACVFICAFVPVCVFVCISMCVYICVCVCFVYVYTYVCVYVHLCIYVHYFNISVYSSDHLIIDKFKPTINLIAYGIYIIPICISICTVNNQCSLYASY